MTLLHNLSYAAAVAAFAFMVLSLASGLLWISELIEEHSRVAKAVGQRGIYIIILLHCALYYIDSLPLGNILFSIVCHVVYLQNFSRQWPLISLTSVSFLASCVLVVADHFLWFFYFARITQDAKHRAHRVYGRPSTSPEAPRFAEIATFFTLCIWMAPLFLFLSLSANDNALPTMTGIPATPTTPATPVQTRPKVSLFRSIFRIKRRDTSEGIIAPRSPNVSRPGSPAFGSPALGSPALSVPMMSYPPRRIPSSPSGSPRVSIDGLPAPMMFGTPPRRDSPKPLLDVGPDRPGLGLRRVSSSASDFGVLTS